jgi:hypothetical protein
VARGTLTALEVNSSVRSRIRRAKSEDPKVLFLLVGELPQLAHNGHPMTKADVAMTTGYVTYEHFGLTLHRSELRE